MGFTRPCLLNFHVLGSTTGILKGASICNKISFNLNSVDSSCTCKENEITCMCWWDAEENHLLTGLKNGRVRNYNLEEGTIIDIPKSIPEEKTILRSIKAHEKTLLISAFNTGKVNCEYFTFPSDSTCVKQLSADIEINSGQDLFCMDHNLSFHNQIATGGKENPLKIWDITSPSNPIFTAKNVANDWLNLRVPVWVMKAHFMYQSKKIITGTGFSQIRLYDPTTQRRPVIELQIKDNKDPITAMALRPNSDHQLVVGTTVGNLALFDLRKKSMIRNYKGFAGGITDVKFHASYPYFAASGVDRYVRCYEIDAKKKDIFSIYLQSQLNCLLFSSICPLEDEGHGIKKKTLEKSCRKLKDADDEDDIVDDESVWNQMEVIQTKKRKNQSTSHPKVKKRAT
ncbi:WD repeat-containing protein 74 [Bulinus truncatus]|nr:WD repeat-containing protein 74 [Bulinus truncatus]